MKDKLIKVVKSKDPKKKYEAVFSSGKRTKFGSKGYEDFTTHKDVERMKRYRKRHEKDLKTGDPTRAGYLSMDILWSKKTLKEGIEYYKKKHNM